MIARLETMELDVELAEIESAMSGYHIACEVARWAKVRLPGVGSYVRSILGRLDADYEVARDVARIFQLYDGFIEARRARRVLAREILCLKQGWGDE